MRTLSIDGDSQENGDNQNNSGSEETSDEDLNWLNSLETSSVTFTYHTPPPELLSLLEKLCRDNSIEHACWSHSTTEEKRLIVSGKGITDEKKTQMETAMREGNFEFVVEFFNCETLTHHLSSRLRK